MVTGGKFKRLVLSLEMVEIDKMPVSYTHLFTLPLYFGGIVTNAVSIIMPYYCSNYCNYIRLR